MEVLARIPQLSCPAVAVAEAAAHGVEVPRQREVPAVPIAAKVPPSAPDPVPAAADADVSRRRAARRSAAARFPAPSVMVLLAAVAAFWAAAWRSERLRWEAAQQQRPARLAQELPATAGVERSRTP